MQGEFRLAGNISEFISRLNNIKKSKHNLLLWQSVNNKKTKFTGKLKSITEDNDKVIIDLDLNDKVKFQQNNPIFIHDEVDGLLFKGSYEFFINKNLKLLVDEKVFLKDKRVKDRHAFHYTRVEAHVVYENTIQIPNSLVKDINASGVGLIIRKNIADQLKVGSSVTLNRIYNIDLPKPINGKIIHKTLYKKVKNVGAKAVIIGIKFDTPSKLLEKVVSAF